MIPILVLSSALGAAFAATFAGSYGWQLSVLLVYPTMGVCTAFLVSLIVFIRQGSISKSPMGAISE